MPHIVIEYSENLRLVAPRILQGAHGVVTASGLFDPQAVKARSVAYDDYALPEGARNFLHVTVSILEGRSTEERTALSKAVFDEARRIAPELDRLSVEIREMVKATYTK